MRRGWVCLMIFSSLVFTGSAVAWAGEKDPMNIVQGALDEIHLKVPTISAGVPIVIRPFSTEGVDLGTGGENAKNPQRSEATQTMVKIAPDMLVEAFKSALVEGGVFKDVLPPEGGTIPENALVVEGKFLKIDPGSKAKRYWAGFGAGKSGVQVTGSVKDASGKVLAEFTHLKHSGIGLFGGEYVKFLSDDTKDVGRDIAKFLTKWAAGQDLHAD